MDQGKDLMISPHGPWTSHLLAKSSAFPIVQHHPKMTVRNTVSIFPQAASGAPNTSQSGLPYPGPRPSLPQSGSLLPLEYDSLLALVDLGRRSSAEPVLALIPLFVHAAFSEVQFLNLLDIQIAGEVDALASDACHGSLQKLQYLSRILERHSANLRNCIRAISILFEPQGSPSSGERQWKDCKSPNPGSEIDNEADGGTHPTVNLAPGTFTVKGLMEDYQELLSRSIQLTERCTMGIQTMMNKAMVLESQKAIEQAERVKKLTLLASFFIPLSFTASFFGMNLEIFGQGSLAIWWFFVLGLPVTVLAQVYYVWNAQKVKGLCQKWSKKDWAKSE